MPLREWKKIQRLSRITGGRLSAEACQAAGTGPSQGEGRFMVEALAFSLIMQRMKAYKCRMVPGNAKIQERNMADTTRLTDFQLELLKLFSRA